MKLGNGRLKWSKLPEAPPPPPNSTSNSNSSSFNSTNVDNNSSTNTTPTTSPNNLSPNSTPKSSKSSPHLSHRSFHAGVNSVVDDSRISSSQSRSSNSLMQKPKWGADLNFDTNNPGSSNEIYELLAEQKLSDSDVWGGHSDLFPILFQYKDLFSNSTSSNNNQPQSPNSKLNNNQGNVLSINLPNTREFGDTRKRSYKISKKLTVAQTVNLICKKQQIKDPRRFWLSTLMGCIMNDDLLLSTYGFGSFFSSWELNLIFKDQYLQRIQTESLNDVAGEFIIDFQLPPLKQLGGLKKKRIKVDSTIPISQIIEIICKKYKIEDPNRFSIITNEEFPLVLHQYSTLSHYGLGTKFNTWELNIVFTEFIPPYSLRNHFVPSYGMFQVGNIDQLQAKAVVVDLENKLHESLQLNEEMVSNIKKMASEFKEKENELKEKENHHLSTMNQIEEQLTFLKESVKIERENHGKQLNEIRLDKETLFDNIKSLEENLESLNSKLYQERASNTETNLQLNFAITNLKDTLEFQKNINQDLQQTIKDLEAQIERLELSIQDNEKEFKEKLEKKDQEKIELKHHYEALVQKIKKENEDKIEEILVQFQQEREKQQEEFHRIEKVEPRKISSQQLIEDSSSSTEISIKLNELALEIDEKNQEKEALTNIVGKLNQELSEKDNIIKSVYPKKIATLESNIKKLESKLQENEHENNQSIQSIALKSLEIEELKRQIEVVKTNSKETINSLKQTNEQLNSQIKEEERKSRKIQYDNSTLKNELESERINREHLSKTIVDLEASKMALEISSKQREALLLEEIDNLKRPKPPPAPVVTKSPDIVSTDSLLNEINGAKNSLKPVPYIAPVPREHTIATVADILYISMQKRFQSVQGSEEIEDLDDDDEFNDFSD
eukprot:gene5838-7266_t